MLLPVHLLLLLLLLLLLPLLLEARAPRRAAIEHARTYVDVTIDGRLVPFHFDAMTDVADRVSALGIVGGSVSAGAFVELLRRKQLGYLAMRDRAVSVDVGGVRSLLAAAMAGLACRSPVPHNKHAVEAGALAAEADPQSRAAIESAAKAATAAKAAKADRTGKAHQADVAKTVFKILAGVDESSHRSPNSDEAVQSAACRLVAEAREELVRLLGDDDDNLPPPLLYSSAFSYRWLSEPGLALTILSHARDPAESRDPAVQHQRDVFLDLAARFLDMAVTLEPRSTDVLYAGGLVHRVLGNHDRAADLLVRAATLRFGVDAPVAGLEPVYACYTGEPSAAAAPFCQSPRYPDIEIFDYYGVEQHVEDGPEGDRERAQERALRLEHGVAFELRHHAAQIRHLITNDNGTNTLSVFLSSCGSWAHIADELDVLSEELARAQHQHRRTTSTLVRYPLLQTAQSPDRAQWRQAALLVHGRILHNRATPALDASPLGDWDGADLEHRYLNQHGEGLLLAYQDGFLTPRALREIRAFCLESDVFKRVKGEPEAKLPSGYLGAYMENGFASGLLFQIAAALQDRLPRLLSGLRLTQAWAYKYAHGRGGRGAGGDDADTAVTRKGINVHADEASVNVNFWITEDDAGVDSGGLLVWDKAAPVDWDFDSMNMDKGKIYRYLRAEGEFAGGRVSRAVEVPYKANRIVLFNSELFHETGELRFRSGFKRHRINLTFLFGGRRG